jgi:hypothetical protein
VGLNKKMSDDLVEKISVGFQLYGSLWLTSDIFLVCGGGGSAKTGFGNGFATIMINEDGKTTILQKVKTGSCIVYSAIMNNGYLWLTYGNGAACYVLSADYKNSYFIFSWEIEGVEIIV